MFGRLEIDSKENGEMFSTKWIYICFSCHFPLYLFRIQYRTGPAKNCTQTLHQLKIDP